MKKLKWYLAFLKLAIEVTISKIKLKLWGKIYTAEEFIKELEKNSKK